MYNNRYMTHTYDGSIREKGRDSFVIIKRQSYRIIALEPKQGSLVQKLSDDLDVLSSSVMTPGMPNLRDDHGKVIVFT